MCSLQFTCMTATPVAGANAKVSHPVGQPVHSISKLAEGHTPVIEDNCVPVRHKS